MTTGIPDRLPWTSWDAKRFMQKNSVWLYSCHDSSIVIGSKANLKNNCWCYRIRLFLNNSAPDSISKGSPIIMHAPKIAMLIPMYASPVLPKVSRIPKTITPGKNISAPAKNAIRPRLSILFMSMWIENAVSINYSHGNLMDVYHYVTEILDWLVSAFFTYCLSGILANCNLNPWIVTFWA